MIKQYEDNLENPDDISSTASPRGESTQKTDDSGMVFTFKQDIHP
jgi:hypothetical protein